MYEASVMDLTVTKVFKCTTISLAAFFWPLSNDFTYKFLLILARVNQQSITALGNYVM